MSEAALSEVTGHTSRVTSGGGNMIFGTTALEIETLEMLLETRTYFDCARRLGCSEGAVKQRISRIMMRYHRAKQFTNEVEEWKRKRRAYKRGKTR